MSWKNDLLTKTGGEFNLIWLLAHKKAKKKTSLDAELINLDISAKCEALLKYQPTKNLNADEAPNKMSLYLLAVLHHGIVIAFARKTDIVLRKLNEALKLFQPLQAKQAKKVTKRKAEVVVGKAKRRRRNTMVMLQSQEEAEEEEQLINLGNLPVEPVIGRFQVRDIRQITLNEYDERPQGFFEPDLRDLENMMQFEIEQLSESSREAIDPIIARPGSPVASINEEMQSLFAELVEGMDMGMAALSPHQQNLTFGIDSNYLEQQYPNARAMLYSSLQLPVLNENEILNNISAERPVDTAVKRKHRARNLIVDKRTEMTDAQIRHNLENTRDIRSTRQISAIVVKPPTASELFAPVTHFLRYHIEKRYEMTEHREEPMQEFELPPPELDFQEPIIDFIPQEIARRSSSMQPREQSPFQEFAPMDINQFEQPPQVVMDEAREGFDQIIEQQDQAENPMGLDGSLLERIEASKNGRERIEFMDFANRTSKITLARDFVNLLHLLKHRVIRAEQDIAYGPISIETV